MSNHKMQFPSHISKSWLSVCIFIFLLTVCVGLGGSCYYGKNQFQSA